MYSIADQSTFEGLTRWIKEVNEYNENIILIVVGTKKDLEHKRQVPFETAKKYAESCGAMNCEISALEDKGCNELINTIATQLIKNKLKQLKN
jgi:GTPase SAR1 family protein